MYRGTINGSPVYDNAMVNANISMQMMGGLSSGVINNNMFLYSGNPMGLQSRL